MKDCDCKCKVYFHVKPDTSQYHLTNFTFENLKVEAQENGFSEDMVENMVVKNVSIKEKTWE